MNKSNVLCEVGYDTYSHGSREDSVTGSVAESQGGVERAPSCAQGSRTSSNTVTRGSSSDTSESSLKSLPMARKESLQAKGPLQLLLEDWALVT